VELSQRHPSEGEATETSPGRDDYTVIEILGVAPASQDELIAVLGAAHDWLPEVPGYRSQSVLRGIKSRGPQGGSGGDLTAIGTDNDFVVVYSQWDSKESYDAYQAVAADSKPAARRRTEDRRDSLTTAVSRNTYRIVHSRSAPELAVA
jgi:heme-degrading monooxygenase HmoA